MRYEVRPLIDEADIVPWVKIHYEAFLASDPYRWIHPPTSRSFEQLAAGRRRKLHNPNSRLFKAIDTTSSAPISNFNANEVEKIVGVAVWTVYPEPLKPGEPERYADGVSVPIEGQNEDAMKAFRSGLYSARREVVGAKAHVLLDGIVVSPEYQRQGIGGLLMKWGLEEADRYVVVTSPFTSYHSMSSSGRFLT